MTTTPLVWKDSFLANPSTVGTQSDPDLTVLSDGFFLSVWVDDTAGSSPGTDIFGTIFDPYGNIVAHTIPLNQFYTTSNVFQPTIAATNDGGFFLAYEYSVTQGNSSISFDRYDINGNLLFNGNVISQPLSSGFFANSHIVTRSDNSAVIVYQELDGSDLDVWVQIISSTGQVGSQIQVNSPSHNIPVSPELTLLSNDDVLITYTSENGFSASAEIYSSILSSSGSLNTVTQVTNNSVSDNLPQAEALINGGHVILWLEDGTNISAQITDSNGTSNIVSLFTGGDFITTPVVTHLNDGGFFVAWENTTQDRLDGQRYDASGNSVGGVVTISTEANNPNGTISFPELSLTLDGRIVVTWRDGEIFNQILDPRDNATADPFGRVFGTQNDDVFTGNFARADGLEGNDVFTGGVGVQTINGDEGNDQLYGLGGDDVISGGEGNDIVSGGDGSDVLDGGNGTDALDYQNSDAAIVIDLVTSMASGGHAQNDTISNFEDVIGSAFDDVVFGSEGSNTILGLEGNDTIMGRGGDDILDGGDGTDYAVYDGVQANFTITENMDGTFTITDNAGTDNTDTLSNIEFLSFTDGDVDLSSAGTFTEGDDVVDGTQGDDIFDALGGNDIVDGLGGNDIISGGGGNDRLLGNIGDDTLNGDAGADTLIGGAGADALNGGTGFDSADYRGASSAVHFNVDTGGTFGEALGDTFSAMERFYLSNFNDIITGSNANEFFFGEDGNDTINAGGGIDRIYGGEGNDIQRGQEGNDTLYGSAGNDQLNGGAGFDIANYSLAGAAVVLSMLTGGTGGDAAGDTYFGIEAVYGTDFGDSLTGNNSANELRGGDGDDALFGFGGNDRFFGGEGADSFDGGTGTDVVNYTLAPTGVILDLGSGGTGGEAAGDSFTSIEWVFGSDFDDIITGDAAANSLEGRDGNDTLNGAAGNDRLLGGDGNDTINGGDGVDTIFGQDGDDILSGGAGNDFFFGDSGADSHDGGTGTDTVSYLASSSGVIVNMQGFGTASTGDATGDSFTSIERIFGSGHDDNLLGNTDNNTLLGNGGDDYLAGGGGNDSLNGGAGIDSFGYDEVVDGADVITGFTLNETVFIFGGTVTDFASLQALGSDAGANVIFDFGGGNTLTIVGHNLADLDASNFDFSGTPPAAEPLSDPDAFSADVVEVLDMDALI